MNYQEIQARIAELEFVSEQLKRMAPSNETGRRWIADRLATLRAHTAIPAQSPCLNIGDLVARTMGPLHLGTVIEPTMADRDRRSHAHLTGQPMVLILWSSSQRSWEYVSDLRSIESLSV